MDILSLMIGIVAGIGISEIMDIAIDVIRTHKTKKRKQKTKDRNEY